MSEPSQGATVTIRKPSGPYKPTPVHWPRNTPHRREMAALWRQVRREQGASAARELWHLTGEACKRIAADLDARFLGAPA